MHMIAQGRVELHIKVCLHNQIKMKGQSEIAYLPKFAIIMLIVMVMVKTDLL